MCEIKKEMKWNVVAPEEMIVSESIRCVSRGHELTTSVFLLQRIRELEDRIDLQKRQIKEIEEKVHTQIWLVFY